MADWMLLDYDPVTQRRKYVMFDHAEGLIRVRETMPVDAVIEANKTEANDWQNSGGWGARKLGAVVARVPLILDNELKKRAGFDPTKGGAYDKDKYNSFLDDIDYRHLRTGGGRIGKKRKIEAVRTPKIRALITAGT